MQKVLGVRSGAKLLREVRQSHEVEHEVRLGLQKEKDVSYFFNFFLSFFDLLFMLVRLLPEAAYLLSAE